MNPSKLLVIFSMAALVSSCGKKKSGDFSVSASLTGLADQKAIIEEIHFTGKNPTEILDTTDVKGGKFAFSVKAMDEGLYRIRFENENSFLFVINDESEIKIGGNFDAHQIQTESFNTPANKELKSFIQ